MNPYEATRRAAEIGIERAANGAADWRDFMERIVTDTARRLPVITMDDIRDEMAQYVEMEPPPFNLMAFGSVMRKMQNAGVIRRMSGEVPSRTVKHHANRIPYQSLIFYPGAFVTPSGVQPPLMSVD